MSNSILWLTLTIFATVSAFDCNDFDYTGYTERRMLPDPEDCHMYYGCDKVDKAGGVSFLHEYHFSCGEKYWSQKQLRCIKDIPAEGCATLDDSEQKGASGSDNETAIGAVNGTIIAKAVDGSASVTSATNVQDNSTLKQAEAAAPVAVVTNDAAPGPDNIAANVNQPDADALDNSDLNQPQAAAAAPAPMIVANDPDKSIASSNPPYSDVNLNVPQAAAPAPFAAADPGPGGGPSSSPNCPYKPVAGHPEKFESKTVPGAIYTCPVTLVFDFFFFPCGCFRAPQQSTVATNSFSCPYKPVAGHPEMFESKTIPGAIYNCPVGQIFDFDFFPCGCFPDSGLLGNPQGGTCPYMPVPGFPEQFASKTVVGAIYSCPVGQVFDFDFYPCGCFPV